MTVASRGHQASLSINATPMAFISESLGARHTILERPGMRGTRDANILDTRTGPYTVGGTITLQPSPAELEALMALAIGANGTAAETALTGFAVVIDRDYLVTTYADCKVNRATLRGSQGGIIELALDLVGKTATQNSGTVSTVNSTAPYVFSDLVLTLQTAARETMDFELVIDNQLVTDRFTNSTTLADIPEGPRLVTLRTSHAYNANNSALLSQAVAGANGTLVLTDSSNVASTFTFGALQVPHEDPSVTSKGEIPLILNMVARASGAVPSVGFVQAP